MTLGRACRLAAVAACALLPLTLVASPLDMTTADRLAILYSPQFNFTRDGEPLIHVGVHNGARTMEFSSSGPVRVLPLGDGGPELRVDGRKRMRVTIEDGKKGDYRHWVVVERLPYGQKQAIDAAIDHWVGRGYLPTPHEVGGLFAVGGRRFDSRVVLLGVGGLSKRSAAIALAERLEARFGIETEMHTELLRHSSGTLKISGVGMGEFIHKDVVWVAPTVPGQTFQVRTPRGELKLAGSLVFTADRSGMLSVVNAVPAEIVVKGVVPSEVYTSAPMESLKAQAVAARGEVLSYLGVRHLADPYGLCSEVHCQVYSGLARENPRTNRAVEETRGEVMFESASLGGDWRVVDARYSSSCGGHTEDNDLVWGSEPESYLRGRFDLKGAASSPWSGGINDRNIDAWLSSGVQAWCNTANFGGKRTFRWNKTVDVVTVQEKLEDHKNIGLIKDVKVLRRGVSGRVIKMSFIGTSGEYVLDRELAIRRIFGGLRSSMFSMIIERDDKGRPRRFQFRGGGFGHGSGMCQTGAMAMGGAGRSYKQILTHYYKNISLKKLY